MVYLTQPYTLGYYANHHWVDTPPRMLMPLLAEAMERTGWFRSVLQMPTSLPGDYRLDVDITQLQQEFLQRPSQVRLRLRAHLVELRAPRLLEQRTFEVTEPAASDDPYGGVVATNRALGRLLADIAAWATSLLSQRGSV
jgi:cholesterol transport system auxiliary component